VQKKETISTPDVPIIQKRDFLCRSAQPAETVAERVIFQHRVGIAEKRGGDENESFCKKSRKKVSASCGHGAQKEKNEFSRVSTAGGERRSGAFRTARGVDAEGKISSNSPAKERFQKTSLRLLGKSLVAS